MFSSAARTAASRLSGHVAARAALSASNRVALQPSMMAIRYFGSVSRVAIAVSALMFDAYVRYGVTVCDNVNVMLLENGG